MMKHEAITPAPTTAPSATPVAANNTIEASKASSHTKEGSTALQVAVPFTPLQRFKKHIRYVQ
jgi:hypothetical protein